MSSTRPPRDLMVVAVSLCLWGLGEGMFTYFQPIHLKELGAEPVAIGGILSAIGICMTVAQIPSGYFSDRFGPRPVMWAAWITGTIAAVVMAAASSIPLFVTGMALYGLTAFVVAPMNSYLTQVRAGWNVERAITVPSALYNVGMVAGALLGGVIASLTGIRSIYLISAIFFAISSAVIFLARREPLAAHHEANAVHPHLLNNPRFLGLLGLIFVTMFALYLPQPLTPNFLQSQAGLSYQTIGVLGAIGSLGNAVISFGMRAVEAPLAFIVGQALVAVYALLLWQGRSAAWYGLGFFFIGGYRLARSMTLAYARQYVRASEIGLAYGVVETANSASVIFAPFAAGLLFQANPRLVYMVSLGTIVIVILVNLLMRLRLNQTAGPIQREVPSSHEAGRPTGTQ